MTLCSRGRLYSPPRRAGLAPLKSADQAAPDRPAHGADARGARLFTSS